MSMKLLTPLVTKDKQQEETARKLLRIQEIEELARKTNASLSRAQAEFNEALARNREKWALEEEEHNSRLKEMESEINTLENRKKQALIPIQMYKDEVDKLMLEAKEILNVVKEKEIYNDTLSEKLEEKLTEVSDRENIVQKREESLRVAEQGIESQKEQIKQGAIKLSEEMLMFHEKQQLEEASLLVRKKEVSIAEINFNAKVEKYQRDLEALKIWEKQLKDERGVLDREYTRRKK